MVSKAQKVRLGIFIIIVSVLLLIFLVLVAGNKLMEKRDNYNILYKDTSVNGLQIGSHVKYHGINIGRVDDINIDKDDIRNVIVAVSIKEGTPIKTDVTATLVPVGITGLMQIEISGGSLEAQNLKPGTFIPAGSSAFQNITGKAEILAEKLELTLNNLTELTGEENRQKFSSILGNIDVMLETNQESINGIVTHLDSTMMFLSEFTKWASTAIVKFDRVLDNTEKITGEIAETDIQMLLADMNEAVIQANNAFKHIDLTILKSRQDLLQSLEMFKETTEYLNEFSRQISEDPSLLLRTKKK
jgi:phospholipid/cholesterol/gamma-HCH transport system substrate-binding protein